MSSEFTEETKNNEFVLVPKDAVVETHRYVIDANMNKERMTKLLPVFLSTEAVEWIKEAEASALERYEKYKETLAEHRERWNAHTKLVDELMQVRNYLNP